MNKTSIEWTDYTVNPIKSYENDSRRVVWGCVKVSPGCQHCYAEALAHRYGRGGPFTVGRMATLTPYLDEAELRAMLSPKRLPAGSKVFVGDMTDVFGPWVQFEMLDRMFAVFALRPDVVFQVLTKRPERMREYLSVMGTETEEYRDRWDAARQWLRGQLTSPSDRRSMGRWEYVGVMMAHQRWPLPNVWLGTSVEDQARADERIPDLLACPAAVRFVSYEPALGPVDLTAFQPFRMRHTWIEEDGRDTSSFRRVRGILGGHLNWVIVGGESGPGARPCDVGWIRSIVAQCQAAAVPVFVKQAGSKPYTNGIQDHGHDDIGEGTVFDGHRTHWKLKSRKGGDPSEWPEDLKVRQFPQDGSQWLRFPFTASRSRLTKGASR